MKYSIIIFFIWANMFGMDTMNNQWTTMDSLINQQKYKTTNIIVNEELEPDAELDDIIIPIHIQKRSEKYKKLIRKRNALLNQSKKNKYYCLPTLISSCKSTKKYALAQSYKDIE